MEELFTLTLERNEEGLAEALIRVDPGAEIYKGHFPGFPITPGVCQVQMVRTALEAAMGRSLRLSGARNIKFTRMHEPAKAAELKVRVLYREEEGNIHADAMLFRDECVYLKLKGIFIERKGGI